MAVPPVTPMVGFFPLALAEEGARVRIVGLRAGRGLDRRLAEMGLNPGAELTVRMRQPGGALVVSRGEARLALGAGMAHKILVESSESASGAAPLTASGGAGPSRGGES